MEVEMSDWYINTFFNKINKSRGLLFGSILVIALISFELFNFGTTQFAFSDFLGGLDFFGISWAIILAVAFCAIDFAGIARLFTPENGQAVRSEAWYLLLAWFLAGTMNAILTWWGVSVAILTHPSLGNELIERSMLLRIVPVFIAAMVWIIRVLIIGTYSQAGERLFSQADHWFGQPAQPVSVRVYPQTSVPAGNYGNLTAASFGSQSRFNPVPKPVQFTPNSSVAAQPGDRNHNPVQRF